MYQRGEGVPKDAAEAAGWYRRAAEQGDAMARAELGAMYLLGMGVSQDYLQAHVWLSLAASRVTGSMHEMTVELRDGVAGLLSLSELARALLIAEEWRAKAENE